MNEAYPNHSSIEIHTPKLSDSEIAAITAWRDNISAEIIPQRKEEGHDIEVTLVAIDDNGNLVHIVENRSNLSAYFTVRSGRVSDLVNGVSPKTEILAYGTERATRFRGSGTIIELEDGSIIFMSGPFREDKGPLLNGKPLYLLGDDDRPMAHNAQR